MCIRYPATVELFGVRLLFRQVVTAFWIRCYRISPCDDRSEGISRRNRVRFVRVSVGAGFWTLRVGAPGPILQDKFQVHENLRYD
ncbi:hypothetical protein HPP92_010488 [Vanilla planifolia]|uniref:Uncharacterized protein n=1 Tax=Vanilla planifolia TaxID=51239 RepID=A0A835QTZ0_VANPL|nr:hypothetical protein HPP92_010488 [Vanilla planifolia]